MKFEIIKPINEEWTLLGRVLNALQYESYKLANRTIQMLWDFQNLSFSYKERFGEFLKMKDLPSKCGSIRGDIGNQLREHFQSLPSGTFDNTMKKANQVWDTHKKEILKGEKSIINFKRTFPIPLRDRQVKLLKEENSYYFNLGLLSMHHAETLGRKKSQTQIKVLIAASDKT